MTAPVVNLHDRFDEFWQHYPGPRKKRKAECRDLFNAITSAEGYIATRTESGVPGLRKATPEQLVLAAKAEAWVSKDDRQYVPMPYTWLYQGRFEDYDNVEELAAKWDDWCERVEKYERSMGLR